MLKTVAHYYNIHIILFYISTLRLFRCSGKIFSLNVDEHISNVVCCWRYR